MNPPKPCYLYLEDGTFLEGRRFGHPTETIGELVFNTSMGGYQEVVTDPSYMNQLVVFTAPEIGNYGVHSGEGESEKVHCSGIVVRRYNDLYSHPKANTSLSAFLSENRVMGIEGVDTRQLVKTIRSGGCLRAVLSPHKRNPTKMAEKARSSEVVVNCDLAQQVSTKKPYFWKPKKSEDSSLPLVGVVDYGVKHSILKELDHRGFRVLVLPATTTLEGLLGHQLDGVLLSNGPGDPRAVPYAIEMVRELFGKLPVFGICFGHQLVAQALGLRIEKLKFGHRGANQPVQDRRSKTIQITSQNHSFVAVKDTKLLPDKAYRYTHLNDGTVSGLDLPEKDVVSVQYHPEAGPGPSDARGFFDDFAKRVLSFRSKGSPPKKAHAKK